MENYQLCWRIEIILKLRVKTKIETGILFITLTSLPNILRTLKNFDQKNIKHKDAILNQ